MVDFFQEFIGAQIIQCSLFISTDSWRPWVCKNNKYIRKLVAPTLTFRSHIPDVAAYGAVIKSLDEELD